MDHSVHAASVFNKCALSYQEKYMDVSLYADSLDIFCQNVTKTNASILEIACGPGNITRYLLQKRPDYKILGTDLALDMLALATINNPTAEFRLLDCREMATLDIKYDGIMCGFVLPYLNKVEAIKLIGDAAGLLNEGGVLYISTMEDDYDKSGPELSSNGAFEIFMHYHEAGYLCETLAANGMTIIEEQHQEYPN